MVQGLEMFAQEPRLLRTGQRWLAVSPPSSPLCIGVLGSTEEEAKARFQERLRVWKGLSEQTDVRAM
jgi:hypothetical protein